MAGGFDVQIEKNEGAEACRRTDDQKPFSVVGKRASGAARNCRCCCAGFIAPLLEGGQQQMLELDSCETWGKRQILVFDELYKTGPLLAWRKFVVTGQFLGFGSLLSLDVL
jgi:hypothetical protein